jgi:hypothetical protein
MKERNQMVKIWTGQKPKKEARLKTLVNPCLRSHQERRRRRKISGLKKAFELLTACSDRTVSEECQHFGNMIAAKLRNYNDTIRCVIQNEIMSVF